MFLQVLFIEFKVIEVAIRNEEGYNCDAYDYTPYDNETNVSRY